MKVGYYPLSTQSGGWISARDSTLLYWVSTDHLHIHINDGQDTKANIFYYMMEAMGLQQHVDFATHKL